MELVAELLAQPRFVRLLILFSAHVRCFHDPKNMRSPVTDICRIRVGVYSTFHNDIPPLQVPQFSQQPFGLNAFGSFSTSVTQLRNPLGVRPPSYAPPFAQQAAAVSSSGPEQHVGASHHQLCLSFNNSRQGNGTRGRRMQHANAKGGGNSNRNFFYALSLPIRTSCRQRQRVEEVQRS